MREQTRSRESGHVVERIGHQLRSNVLGLVAIFIVLGGTAYAVSGPLRGHNTVGSADIINGKVTGRDIHKGAVQSSDVRNNDLTGRDVREATLNLAEGARAYGTVDPQTCHPVPGQPVTCQAQEPTEGITRVVRNQDGGYCVRATGIDPENNPAVVSVDQFNSEGNAGDAVAMTNNGDNCGGQTDFPVVTQRHPAVTVNQGGGQNNTTVSGPAEPSNTVGFTIVIP